MTEAKFFLPGPVYVRDEIKEAMTGPTIGHRSKEASDLYKTITSGIAKILNTDGRIYLSSSTATGLMEAAVRNVIRKRSLNLICGAFGKLWYDICISCGKEADAVEVEWGEAIKPELVAEALSTGKYDTVCLTHNETSTGVLNPLEEIAEVVKKFDDVALLVDAVSSMAGTEIRVDDWGLDVCLASVQKAWALPPGFAVAAVSDRALERSKNAENKGHYFDFEVFEKYHQRSQTLSTPSIPHMYALSKQIDDIFEEGLENRYNRHRKMADLVTEWAKANFDLFGEENYLSPTVTCIRNNEKKDIAWLIESMREKGYTMANGYGKLKGETFRIAHMGDVMPEDVERLLNTLDEVLG
ncbi:MAG: alanine--glyoxylate aminotransferase family protein [Candidatus Marinimicrobia bacterium]|nr:alanine--glyoxylate aminotransferase family protein [Candidatus Neomarinimicrobiota bacterium]